MHWQCIYGAVFHLIQSVEGAVLMFRSAGGDVVEGRECSTDSAYSGCLDVWRQV